jgi:hypothetical protein
MVLEKSKQVKLNYLNYINVNAQVDIMTNPFRHHINHFSELQPMNSPKLHGDNKLIHNQPGCMLEGDYNHN